MADYTAPDSPSLRDIMRLDGRIDKVENRIDAMDQHGSRGVGALQVQVMELIKDVSALEARLSAELKSVRTNRWQLVGAFLAAVLPIYGLLIQIVLTKP